MEIQDYIMFLQAPELQF